MMAMVCRRLKLWSDDRNGRKYYQFGGGGQWVLAIVPSRWQLAHLVYGGYRHFFVGPFVLARATGDYAKLLRGKRDAHNHKT
jgi:hypothetical protein